MVVKSILLIFFSAEQLISLINIRFIYFLSFFKTFLRSTLNSNFVMFEDVASNSRTYFFVLVKLMEMIGRDVNLGRIEEFRFGKGKGRQRLLFKKKNMCDVRVKTKFKEEKRKKLLNFGKMGKCSAR